MARRTPNLDQVMAESKLQQLTGGTDGPTGLQWFADIRIADKKWYRDRARIDAVIDGLSSRPWFAEFDVFAAGHVEGAPFGSVDEVREVIASGEAGTVIFAHGEPRMTLDIEDSEAALALDINEGRLVLRLWLGARPVAQYKLALLGDIIALLVALREAWPDTVIASASAFPHPTNGLRYRRTRPLRIANRALDAFVDVLDREVPEGGPPWAREATAMAAAPVPSGVDRIERGPLVIVRWLDDPSDPQAMADACSRHEQWLVPLVPTEIAAGWNERGDLEEFDANIVEVASDDPATWGKPKVRGKQVSLVVPSRGDALAMLHHARAAGFADVLYRDPSGRVWNPHPPGEWVEPPL